MVRHYSAKADRNQPEIVKEFRKLGATVAHIHSVGGGVPDIIIGYKGKTTIIEIKDGTGALTPKEKDFADKWRGSLYICRDVEECESVLWDLLRNS